MASSQQQTFLSRQHQIFLLCCELRSFSKVGELLGLTQSAVSKCIASMEKELGLTLFQRATRPMTMTPEAHVLYDCLRKVSGEFSEVLTRVRRSNAIKPILRIGILESISVNIGVEIIRRLSNSVSQLLMLTGSANILMQRLMERKVDLIISNDLTGNVKPIFRKFCFTEPSILLVPPAMARRSATWTWQSLAVCGLPLISYWKESGAGEVNNLFLRSHDLTFPDRISVDTNTLMVKLVAEGFGWAFTRPTSVIENIQLLPRIKVLPMPQPDFARTVFCMGRADEFIAEGDLIRDIASGAYRADIMPQILSIAPWLKDSLAL